VAIFDKVLLLTHMEFRLMGDTTWVSSLDNVDLELDEFP
jgi:hypothetical protein